MKRLLLLGLLAAAPAFAEPVDHVDPLVGTRNMGHTYPGATVPFGMVQLSPDTHRLDMYDADGAYVKEVYRYCAGYQYEDSLIHGFSHTHFSGTGHSDLGDVSLMPVAAAPDLRAEHPAVSRFRHGTEHAEAGYYRVRLDDPGVRAELTATTRVGLHRYTWEDGGESRLVLDLAADIYDYEGKDVWTFVRVENDTLVTGYRMASGWARTRTVYFAMAFDRPVVDYGHVRLDPEPYKGFYRRFDQTRNFPEMAGRELRADFAFDLPAGEPLHVKVALSPTGIDGALRNLAAEAPGWDFDGARAAARDLWNEELSALRVEPLAAPDLDVLYTAFYHTLLGPVVFEDVDGRYRGLDQVDHVSDGFVNYTVFSLWDTYRALHPWFNLVQVDRNRDMVLSMLAHHDQSVHPMLPIWSHWANENWCMIGYHSVSVIADALVKGMTGVDVDRALEACVTTSRVPYFDGVGEYMELGYVPDEASGVSTSITLELAYDDFCIAALASLAREPELQAEYFERSRAFARVYDPESGFMRPRRRDGTFRPEFDTLATHGQGFIEGNAWTYSLYVPHDPDALAELLGGERALGAYLDRLFTMELDDEHIAHTEDITRDGIIGNYVHGNEPGHHAIYLYNRSDRPWMTEARVRQVMREMYAPGPAGLCGNDDAGQMSAWLLFSALGFYPVCPGSERYELGSPLVRRAELELSSGETLTVHAVDQSEENVYVQEVTLDGRPLTRRFVTHEKIMRGGALVFRMGAEPAYDR